jgi:uncharacterized protein Yka (UPF0111/DUF47 family)
MLKYFRRMLPREDRFFDLFARHAEVGLNAAVELDGLLAKGVETDLTIQQIITHADAIIDLEHQADDITAEVMLATRRSFITPFDRGDIKDLIQSMDDAVDSMQKAVKIILSYRLTRYTPVMREMGGQIVEAATLVKELIPLLERPGDNVQAITNLTTRIKDIESRSDRQHEKGLQALYEEVRSGTGTALDFIVVSRLYDQLEKVVDSLEDVADEVSAVMIENV